MAAVEAKPSPNLNMSMNVSLNGSLGLNHSMAGCSPGVLNLSDPNFLAPSKTPMGRNWSPSVRSTMLKLKSPNISPIAKNKESPADFLKRRDFKHSEMEKRRRRSCLAAVKTEDTNSDLEKTLSVKTVLKDLKLSHHIETFEKEEINLKAMFTLSEEDLKTIGIDDKEERQKILAFISDFSTPQKVAKCASKVSYSGPSKVPHLRH